MGQGRRTDTRGGVEPALVRHLARTLDARIEWRQAGHVFAAEVWVVPDPDDDRTVVSRVEAATDHLASSHWKLHDVIVSPVERIEDVPPGVPHFTRRPAGRSAARRPGPDATARRP